MISRRRVATAIVLASLTTVVLATRTSVGFQPVRERLVNGAPVPPAGLPVVTEVDALKFPVTISQIAVIARVRNESSNSQQVSILIDGQSVCTRGVPGQATERFDCAWKVAWSTGDTHRVEVVGSDPAWTLNYLELATHHGSTRGRDLIILPGSYERRAGPSWPIVLTCLVLLAGVMLLPLPRMGRWVTVIYRVACGFVSVVFGVILISPYVSPFLIVVSVGLFWKCLAVVVVPRWWQAAVWSRHQRHRAWRNAIVGGAAGALLVASYGPVMYWSLTVRHHGNYSGFVQLGTPMFDRHPTLAARADIRDSLILYDNGGYDAQWAYFATYDPLLREFRNEPIKYRRVVDDPSYRYGRIGFSMLTRLIAGDRWHLYPATMVWLVFGGLLACLIGLVFVASTAGNSPMRAALVILVPAFWQSLQASLPEPIAAGLLVGGYACLVQDRRLVAALLFAASLMVRETGAIFVLCLVGAELISGNRRAALTLGALALGPILLWRVFVGVVLSPAFGTAAFGHSVGVFGPPFSGIMTMWSLIGEGQYFGGRADFELAGIWFPLLLFAGLGLAVWLCVRRHGAVAVAALLYGLVAISMTYEKVWQHVSNGQRGTFELFLMLAIVSASDTTRLPRALRGALVAFWAATAGYVFYGVVDALAIREAINIALF